MTSLLNRRSILKSPGELVVKKLIFITLAIVFVSCPDQTQAASSRSDWQKDKSEVTKIISKDCKKAFEILWPWAKDGNQEARFALLFYTMMGDMYWPEGSDNASRQRDIIILAIHSSGYKISKNENDLQQAAFLMGNLDKTSSGKQFLKCLENKGSDKCVNQAVEESVVPSFESFSEQTEILLSNGFKIECNRKSGAY